MVTVQPKLLGELLVERGALPRDALTEVLRAQAGSGRRLGELLVSAGRVDEETVARSLADQLGLPYLAPPLEPHPEASRLLSPDLARDRRVLLLRGRGRTLRLAMADPLDTATLDDVRFQAGRRVEPAVAAARTIQEGLARTYGEELDALVRALPGDPSRGEDPEALERAARAAPVVRLVDYILARAVETGASDIHVERAGSDVRIRYRVDGLLREVGELPPRARRPILSRLKVMAGLDIAVKRRPQDGRLVLRHAERELTLRVSTLPVVDGEKAVVRLLDPGRAPPDLSALGLTGQSLRRLRAILRGGRGVLLATGPTGSGKSSTLRAAIQEVDRERLNVVTLEDPVEYPIPGATQVQVDPRAGLTFPAALRSVLRQDPDVVMVGEIRDRETAEIAMAAAVTGHLVLSTLHTIDAPGAVTRLLDMGVAPYLVAGGLAGVLAQRLVRRACQRCRGKGDGCARCRDGYRGRTGIFQMLVVDDALREVVTREGRGAGPESLRRTAREGGMGSMEEDARRKVAEGLTTPHEVGRVLHGDPAALPCSGCGTPVPSGAEGCPGCGRPRHRRCSCGRMLLAGWRFCPFCLRKAS